MTKKFSLPIALFIVLVAINGCKKDTAAANQAFVGTYYGSLSADQREGGVSRPDTLKVTAGSSTNQIVMTDPYGITVTNANVSGNALTITSDNGGGTASGTGNLSGSTLTFTEFYAQVGILDTNTFTGIKH